MRRHNALTTLDTLASTYLKETKSPTTVQDNSEVLELSIDDYFNLANPNSRSFAIMTNEEDSLDLLCT